MRSTTSKSCTCLIASLFLACAATILGDAMPLIHWKTIIVSVVIIVLLTGATSIYWAASKPKLSFDRFDVVAYEDYVDGTLELVVSGSGRLTIESMQADIGGGNLRVLGFRVFPSGHDADIPTTLDLPSHLFVHVSGPAGTVAGSPTRVLIVHITGTWLFLTYSMRVNLKAETTGTWM